MASVSFAACAPLPTNLSYDKRAVQGGDCAFKNAAQNDVHGHYTGKAPVDLGHEQVGQRLSLGQAHCGGVEQTLLILDCSAGKALALSGTADPVFGKPSPMLIGAIPNTSVVNIQPPHGPIALGRGTSLAALQATAKKHGIGRRTGVSDLRVGKRPRNRVDFWCGCKRFYPSSAGARK